MLKKLFMEVFFIFFHQPFITTLRTIDLPVVIPLYKYRSIFTHSNIPSYRMYLRQHRMEINRLPLNFFKIGYLKPFKPDMTIWVFFYLQPVFFGVNSLSF